MVEVRLTADTVALAVPLVLALWAAWRVSMIRRKPLMQTQLKRPLPVVVAEAEAEADQAHPDLAEMVALVVARPQAQDRTQLVLAVVAAVVVLAPRQRVMVETEAAVMSCFGGQID
jgi:predicted AAA+ superfamily ATPase